MAQVTREATISKLQLVRALRTAGRWEAVRAALAQADAQVQEDWQMAHLIERGDPLVVGMAESLGLSEAEMDQLFLAGAGL